MAFKLVVNVFILSNVLALVLGHGYMIEPASRNACYKKFKQCVPNYNANEQFCGGRDVMVSHGGKCGACGDEWGKAIHVYPGRYATGFITKTYKQGQVITTKIHITANHQGWFEFRVGDIGSPPITQSKLKYLLKTPEGKTRIPLTGTGSSYETIRLRLPAGLTCKHCVIQWWWKVGNSWGCDKEGCGLGHGDQETFVNCADIKIVPEGGVIPPITDTPQTSAPTEPPSTAAPTEPPVPNTPSPGSPYKNCKATGPYTGNARLDKYCRDKCAAGKCARPTCKCQLNN